MKRKFEEFDAAKSLSDALASLEPLPMEIAEGGDGLLADAIKSSTSRLQYAQGVASAVPGLLDFMEGIEAQYDQAERLVKGGGEDFLSTMISIKESSGEKKCTVKEAKELAENKMYLVLNHTFRLIRATAHRARLRHLFSRKELTREELQELVVWACQEGYFIPNYQGLIWAGRRYSLSADEKFGLDKEDEEEIANLVREHVRRLSEQRRKETQEETKALLRDVDVSPEEVWRHGAQGAFVLEAPAEGDYPYCRLAVESQVVAFSDKNGNTRQALAIKFVKAIVGAATLNERAEEFEEILVELDLLKDEKGNIRPRDFRPRFSPPRLFKEEEWEKWLKATVFFYHILRRGFGAIAKVPENEIHPRNFVIWGRKGQSTLTFSGRLKWQEKDKELVVENPSLLWERKEGGILQLKEISRDDEQTKLLFGDLVGKNFAEGEKYHGVPGAGGVFLRLCFSQLVNDPAYRLNGGKRETAA